jgi:uncharacterized membrane protein YfcA
MFGEMDITLPGAALLVLLGLAIGAFGTLIGAGGGFILTPILLLLYPQAPPEVITSISLAVVLCNALSGSIAYARMRRIDYRSGVVFALATIPGAILGAMVIRFIPRGPFDILFGVLLVVFAVYIVVRQVGKGQAPAQLRRGWTRRSIKDVYGYEYEYSFNLNLGLAISFGVGFVSSLLGIGGGFIHVAMLVQVLSFPAHIATATSLFILVTTALTGTAVHVVAGDFSDGVLTALCLAVGVIAGAYVGAHIAPKVRGLVIVRMMAVAVGLVGVRLVLHGVSL